VKPQRASGKLPGAKINKPGSEFARGPRRYGPPAEHKETPRAHIALSSRDDFSYKTKRPATIHPGQGTP
jgi:hypothetical protein